MEFDELKKIWDTQNSQPLYAIDEAALHRRVIKKQHRVTRMASVSERGMFLIMFLLAVAMIFEGIRDNELYQLPGGALMLIAAGYIYRDRGARLAHQGLSDQTLLGDLNMAIRTIDYHSNRQRNFVWWFLAPVVCSTMINMAYTWQAKPWWIGPMVVASFVLGYWMIRREQACTILPAKKELEALRELLEGGSAG